VVLNDSTDVYVTIRASNNLMMLDLQQPVAHL